MRLLPESGQVLLAAAILSASIIVRPAPPVIADTAPSESVVHVEILVPEQPAPIANVEILIPEQPAPVVHVDVAASEPSTIIVEPAPVLPAEIIYEDREVERIVEVPSCLDYAQLPHFDLANALVAAFPGAQWSLSGSHYPGLVWRDEQPQPDMTQIIGGWLAHLAADC